MVSTLKKGVRGDWHDASHFGSGVYFANTGINYIRSRVWLVFCFTVACLIFRVRIPFFCFRFVRLAWLGGLPLCVCQVFFSSEHM